MNLLWKTLADLWRLLDRRERKLAIGLVFLLFVSGLFEMGGIVFLFGYIGALASETNGNPAVTFYRSLAGDFDGSSFAAIAGMVLLMVLLLKNVIGVLTSFMLTRFSMKRYERISTEMFASYLGAPLELIQDKGAGQAINMLRAATRVFRDSFNAALAGVSEVAIIVTVMTALLFFLPITFVVASGLLFGVGGVAFLAATKGLSDKLGQRQADEEREIGKIMQEGMRGIVDIRLSRRENAATQRFARTLQRLAMAERRGIGLRTVPRAFNEMLLAAGIVLAAVYFAGQAGGLAGAVPILAVAGFAGLRLTAALSRLTENLQRLRQGSQDRLDLMKELGSLEGIKLDSRNLRVPEEPSVPVSKTLAAAPRQLEADRIVFSYPGSDVSALRDVSLVVPRGAFVGFCGPSGGGKSTLALVLMGLIEPDSGQVRFDGRDIREDLGAWYDQIGFVGQQPFIAPRTLRENIAFSFEPNEIDDSRVWQALEVARIAEFIRGLPDGLETNMGEEGSRLSGGQRQRVSIARALYRDPSVLVFDEATAALDNVTEAELTRAIENFGGDKTIIAIAHRLSTLRSCDCIYFVKDGRISASGTFDELEKKSPGFLALLKGFEAEEPEQKTVADGSPA